MVVRGRAPSRPATRAHAARVIFFGARIRLGTILCRFSINYFSGLGLMIRVRVCVRVRVRVWDRVRVSVMKWSG